jgi:outer membrane protein assembly factor BamB
LEDQGKIAKNRSRRYVHRIMRRWLLLALAGCAAPPPDDWPRWRGRDGSAVQDGSPLPCRWSPSENVRWSAEIPGEGASSPVVSGSRVFLTSSLEGGTRRALHALDRATGRLLWSREVRDPDPERASALAGHAAATPATDGTCVIAFFGNAGVLCVEVDGTVRWRRELGAFESELGLGSSPILHAGRAILVCDHDGSRFTSFDSFIVAIDLATGEVAWKAPRPGLERSWSTPILAEGRLVVNAQDELRAYDPATGRELWKVGGMTGWVAPSPVFGEGRIFATSGKNGPVLAVDPEGRVLWQEASGGPYVCSPLLYRGLLYVHDESGILTCRDASRGRVLYRERLRGKFTASPVAGDGKVYATSEEGVTSVLRAGERFEILAENRLGDEVLASPALAGGGIFLRTRRRLFCIGGK